MSELRTGPIMFSRPEFLALLILIPVAVLLYRVALRRRRDRALIFSAVDLLLTAPHRRQGKRHIPFLAVLSAAAMLMISTADPQIQGSVSSQKRQVIIVLDVSRSMDATDVAPTRLAAAQEGAKRFLDRVPQGYEIGLVLFAGVARVGSIPTTDRALLKEKMSDLTVENGTATGDSLVLALSQFGQETKGGVVVLLSDGRQTAGRATLEQASGMLKAAGVRVYAIALGTPEGTMLDVDQSTGVGKTVAVPPDPAGLDMLTSVTGGETFSAVTIDELNTIYDSVGGSLTTQAGWVAISSWFALLALILLGLAGLAGMRWTPTP